MTLKIGRRGDEYQRIILLGNTVQVTVEVYLIGIEMNARQISGVMSQTPKVLDTVITAHIPSDMMGMSHHNLGYGCCPAAATDDCYLSTVKHVDN